MRVLIYSHFFAPRVGGVEAIVLSLALGLAELRESNGAPQFEITFVTQTMAGNYDDGALPFRTVRQPGLLCLWRLIRSSDVVHIAGPALAPLVMSHLSGKPVPWLLFEDFARKYLGNNMAIYFAKDVLAAVVYLSFFLAYRRKEVTSFRPPFLVPVLLFVWFGVMQVFNPASTHLIYGVLGLKLFFYYIPLLFVGYALSIPRPNYATSFFST
jgi:glycosyltransferase involved in cell wall biosynthesis